ncbi:unnamed protein product [marine sediment metagenome]|uniref:Uncharacterized protein n=1 Tax=marine sediment metagenome TaxID=412755 RepID=X1C0L2_9ZZZZ
MKIHTLHKNCFKTPKEYKSQSRLYPEQKLTENGEKAQLDFKIRRAVPLRFIARIPDGIAADERDILLNS